MVKEVKVRYEPPIFLGAGTIAPVRNSTKRNDPASWREVGGAVDQEFHACQVRFCSCRAANCIEIRDTIRANRICHCELEIFGYPAR